MKEIEVLKIYDQRGGRDFPLTDAMYFAGRGGEIEIDDPAALPEQVKLKKGAAGWMLEVLDGAVLFNGRPLEKGDKTKLKPGDFFEIGGSRAVYLTEAGATAGGKAVRKAGETPKRALLQSLDHEGLSFEIVDEFTFIGRLESNRISLPWEGISDRHAMIMIKEGRYYLFDLVSRLGTTYNGIPLAAPVELRVGDMIAFDRQRFTIADAGRDRDVQGIRAVHAGSAKPAPAAADRTMVVDRDSAFGAPGSASLRIEHGPGAGKCTDLAPNDRLLIARRKVNDNTLVIDHPSISRQGHCLIYRDEEQWRIVDQGSTNGVVVNGRTVSTQILPDNSEIILGEVILRFTLAGGRGETPGSGDLWDKKTVVDDGDTLS